MRLSLCAVALGFIFWGHAAAAQDTPLRAAIDRAVDRVKPALVRIHVVETYYNEGREQKFEASGSGVILTPEGHVITNHHVAGHAKQLKCTLSSKEEIDAELVAGDPLTDIAIIKLVNPDGRAYPTVSFGDSDAVRVGDHVLAMGSPLSLSQSVTLGIVSNTQLILPSWLNRFGGLEQDGEDVGGLVRWLAHDAEIHPGNSGGPLVNLAGEIIGINEIKIGLSGAIPGNLARQVAETIIREGAVRRAWLGIEIQPLLKHSGETEGVLVSGAFKGSPAEDAGIQPGDRIISLAGKPVTARFAEDIPDFNLLEAGLPIGDPVELVLVRDGGEKRVTITPMERQKREPKEYEIKEWGITVRNISFLMAKELKRESTGGVLVTSVRPGGPAGDAKPVVTRNDVLVRVGEHTVRDLAHLREITREVIGDSENPVPVLTVFERKNQQFLTVVRVGIEDIIDPSREVKKAWLPVETQVVTSQIAQAMHRPGLGGFRVTQVYKRSTAEKAGLQVGDIIVAVDDTAMTATEPEHYEELSALIRQYSVGTEVQLSILRDGAERKIPVELVRAPPSPREMRKYKNEDFEFTVREITFFDRAAEEWSDEQQGVLVEQVRPGGWAALGSLSVGDLIQSIDGVSVGTVDKVEEIMKSLAEKQAKSVTFRILRGIHTLFIELEPQWKAL
jgi:serine protease Do